MTFSIRGAGMPHHECLVQKMGALVQENANASGSRRRMAPVSRSAPVLRFVRLRQRFVRRCHGRKEAPAIDDWGKLNQSRVVRRLEFSPIRSAFSVEPNAS